MDEKHQNSSASKEIALTSDRDSEAPAIGGFSVNVLQQIYSLLLPCDQLTFGSVNRRHYRIFSKQNNRMRDRFVDEKNRVLELVKKYQAFSNEKKIQQNYFISLLAEVFDIEQNVLRQSDIFQLAVIYHAMQLAPAMEWYTLVPDKGQTIRRNTLAIRMMEHGHAFQYRVIAATGKVEIDTICVEQFKDFKWTLPLTFIQLEAMKSSILEITEQRKHTMPRPCKRLRNIQLNDIQNHTWFDTMKSDAWLYIEFSRLSRDVVDDLGLIYKNYYNMDAVVEDTVWQGINRCVLILPREAFCQKCLPYFKTGPLRRLMPHQSYQPEFEQGFGFEFWNHHFFKVFSDQNAMKAENDIQCIVS